MTRAKAITVLRAALMNMAGGSIVARMLQDREAHVGVHVAMRMRALGRRA